MSEEVIVPTEEEATPVVPAIETTSQEEVVEAPIEGVVSSETV